LLEIPEIKKVPPTPSHHIFASYAAAVTSATLPSICSMAAFLALGCAAGKSSVGRNSAAAVMMMSPSAWEFAVSFLAHKEIKSIEIEIEIEIEIN